MMEEYYEWLDRLRDSGRVNMFGAAPILAEEFDLSRSEARSILTSWMKTYSERHKEEV